MAGDIKATSIRMDGETRELLNNMTEQMGVSQGQALKAVLQNFADSAAYIGDDSKDLENALYYIQGISDQIRQLIKSRAEAKDRAEKAVQGKLEALQSALEKSQSENRQYRDQIKDQMQKITELSGYKSQVETANREAAEAREALADSRKLVERGEAERQQMADKIARIDDLETENAKLKSDYLDLTRISKQQLDEAKADYLINLAHAEHDFAQKIQEARNEEAERLTKEADRLRDEIRELKDELRALRVERQPEELRKIENTFKVRLPDEQKSK